MYPIDLRWNKTNNSDTEAHFRFIVDTVSSKMNNKWDGLDIGIPLYFTQFLNGDIPLSPSYGIYFSHSSHFARK